MYSSYIVSKNKQSKKKGNDQELLQSYPTSHPQNKKGKDTHKIDKRSRKKTRRRAELTSLSRTGGHLATITENGSNIYFTVFLFQIKNKTKQEAQWATVIQLTVLLKTIYIQT